MSSPITWAAIALVFGLVLFWRGLVAYRRRAQVAGIGTATIASVAVGEARLVGTVRAAEAVLTAPATDVPCVYYRTVVHHSQAMSPSGGLDGQVRVETLSGSTSFFLDDGTGSIRVFPRGASWDVPDDFVHTEPGEPAAAEREDAVAQLLTVRDPSDGGRVLEGGAAYSNETWLQPGDKVTLIGTVLTYGELDDAFGVDSTNPGGEDDPVIAEELAEARAAGLMADSPEEAWGNAAIPGFGIGRPTRPPVLDPDVPVSPLAAAVAAATVAPSVASGAGGVGDGRGLERLILDPQTPVLAAGPGHPLAIFAGTPGQAIARAEMAFIVGAFGAILAMGAAGVLLYLLSGALL